MPPEKITYRLFLALPVPPFICQAVSQAQQQVQTLTPDWSMTWVKPENIHLTLQFLGDTSPQRLQRVQQVLSKRVPDFPMLRLELGGPGVFPSLAQPRIVFWEVLPHPALIHLQRALAKAMRQLGYALEKRAYRPHLTLGRVRQPVPQGVNYPLPQKFSVQTLHWQTGQVELIHSELLPEGPRYHRLATYSLQGI